MFRPSFSLAMADNQQPRDMADVGNKQETDSSVNINVPSAPLSESADSDQHKLQTGKAIHVHIHVAPVEFPSYRRN